jgi:hypothetical protein
MNVKEIASAVNKDERTVARWITKASVNMSEVGVKVSEAKRTQNPADYTLDETCAIIEQGLGKNASALFRANANFNNTPLPESTLTQRDLDLISALTISIMSGLNQRISNIESKIEERQALLPAPEIKIRDSINKIVREYAHETGTPYDMVWRQLYTEYNYRFNSNVSLLAKNRDMKTIDYMDKEGLLNNLYTVAYKIFEDK